MRWFLAVCITCFSALSFSPASHASDEGQLDALIEALKIDDTIKIMREEGLIYGVEVGHDMLPEDDMVGWEKEISRIYDTERMQRIIEGGFESRFEGTDLTPLVSFYQSDLGRRIVTLELDARRIIMDAETESAARIQYEKVRAADTRIIAQIDTMIADSDLVELNVMGALNSNFLFYRGLVDGGAFDLSEDEILADVWMQEEGIREDTKNWLGAFLLMAYQPLTEQDLDTYIALYQSEEGRDLNRIMFETFNQMYDEISYLLGLAIAQRMQSEKL